MIYWPSREPNLTRFIFYAPVASFNWLNISKIILNLFRKNHKFTKLIIVVLQYVTDCVKDISTFMLYHFYCTSLYTFDRQFKQCLIKFKEFNSFCMGQLIVLQYFTDCANDYCTYQPLCYIIFTVHHSWHLVDTLHNSWSTFKKSTTLLQDNWSIN